MIVRVSIKTMYKIYDDIVKTSYHVFLSYHIIYVCITVKYHEIEIEKKKTQ